MCNASGILFSMVIIETKENYKETTDGRPCNHESLISHA